MERQPINRASITIQVSAAIAVILAIATGVWKMSAAATRFESAYAMVEKHEVAVQQIAVIQSDISSIKTNIEDIRSRLPRAK